ncbi:hypothetical protein [Mycobacterium sp. SMC-4]|uniref:hypothetical protein n=1 Tax=Mycobacterium sp. SMC-4 TaxID=2857059 RepID=UPI003D086775
MNAREAAAFLTPALTRYGLQLGEIDDRVVYCGRPAWAIYYDGADCNVQLCWSARDGGIDFMLGPCDARRSFGLADHSGTWRFMLCLTDVEDNLPTPGPVADDVTLLTWLQQLFEIHFRAARARIVNGC